MPVELTLTQAHIEQAHRIAKHLRATIPTCRHVDLSDLESASHMGLLAAYQKYDATRGAFGSFLYRCVQTAVYRELSRHDLVKRPLREVITAPMLSEQVIPDHGFQTHYQLLDQHEWVHRALEQLKPREELLIRLRYLEDMPVGEIAERFQLTPGRVSQLLKRAVATLRKLLTEGSACADRPARPAGSLREMARTTSPAKYKHRYRTAAVRAACEPGHAAYPKAA